MSRRTVAMFGRPSPRQMGDGRMSSGLILYGGGAERAHLRQGDAAAVILPAFVDLGEDFRELELLEEPDHGPRRVELSLESGELGGGGAGGGVFLEGPAGGGEGGEPEGWCGGFEALLA